MDISRYLNQKAVYWAPATADKYGNTAYAAAVELDVRWEECSEEVFDSEGQKIMAKHHLWTEVVVEEGGLVWKGTLAAWGSTPTPTPVTENVSRIAKYQCTGNRKATQFVREAWA